jgi:hypothetical protein
VKAKSEDTFTVTRVLMKVVIPKVLSARAVLRVTATFLETGEARAMKKLPRGVDSQWAEFVAHLVLARTTDVWAYLVEGRSGARSPNVEARASEAPRSNLTAATWAFRSCERRPPGWSTTV